MTRNGGKNFSGALFYDVGKQWETTICTLRLLKNNTEERKYCQIVGRNF